MHICMHTRILAQSIQLISLKQLVVLKPNCNIIWCKFYMCDLIIYVLVPLCNLNTASGYNELHDCQCSGVHAASCLSCSRILLPSSPTLKWSAIKPCKALFDDWQVSHESCTWMSVCVCVCYVSHHSQACSLGVCLPLVYMFISFHEGTWHCN